MDEIERLDQLLDGVEARIKRAFAAFISAVTDEGVVRRVADLIAAGRVEDALEVADSYVAGFANIFGTEFQRIGDLTAVEFANAMPGMASAISFDPTWPRAAELMRRNRLGFIAEFTAQQRAAVRQSLARTFITGQGPAAAERAFRSSVGLTEYQEGIVANYRRRLDEGSRRALDYELRDRRFDRTVNAAIRDDRPLTQAQIDRMVARYHARFVVLRGQTIARTEGLKVMNQARDEALRQMIQQTGINPDTVKRIWNATRDKRTRDSHEAMQGQERGLGMAFQSGAGVPLIYPGDPSAPASEIINCRCVLTFEYPTV